MSHVLVDTSVWIDFFRRGDSEASRMLGELMRAGLVCVSGEVTAEILSGARSQREFRSLRELFAAFPVADDPPDLWPMLAKVRYQLARRGFQASVADLIVAMAASANEKQLFTLDRHFERIAKVLPIKLLHPARH